MSEIVISSTDAARIWSYIEEARVGRAKVSENLVPLMNELNRAIKVKPDEMPSDVVTMNSIVSLLNIKNNKVTKIQIVYPPMADVSQQKISIFAPVGTALLGYRKDDVVEWDTPAGKTQFKILDIVYQPESDRRFDL